jgi:hypothetical protein
MNQVRFGGPANAIILAALVELTPASRERKVMQPN